MAEPRATGSFPVTTISKALLVALLGLAALPTIAQEEAVTVSNGEYETRVVRVAMTDSLHDGMVQPPSDDEAFLLVYLETDDPCFDPVSNSDCFDGDLDELETIAWACGDVELSPDDIRPADGGGLLGTELACSYIIPINTRGLTLRLRDYEAIDVAPRE